MITCRLIKEMVETHFGVPDISIKNRSQKYVYIRYVYYALSRNLTEDSYVRISGLLGYDHSTMTHAIIRFNEYYSQDFFATFKEAYRDIRKILADKDKVLELERQKAMRDKMVAFEIRTEYDKRLGEVIKDSHRQIEELKRKMALFQDPVFLEVASFPIEDFEEFKALANIFVKRKRRENANIHQSA